MSKYCCSVFEKLLDKKVINVFEDGDYYIDTIEGVVRLHYCPNCGSKLEEMVTKDVVEEW